MIFKCKNCGGNMMYEPGRGQMYCPHCESLNSEDIVKGDTLSVCGNCGAPISPGQYTSSGRCEHCGNYIVFDERVTGVYEPHLILPFKLNKDMAVDALEKEFGKRTFTPVDFLSRKSLEYMEGIYVPFWLYDFHANCDFSGEGTKVRSWRSGNTEYVETSYYNIYRKMKADFEKVPVDASFRMDDGEMDLMEPYAYQALEGFNPKYMSGFFGEIYNQDASELEGRAQVKVQRASDNLLQESMQEYNTVTTGKKNLNMERYGTKYALMPVWQYLYQYNGKTYRFHVNGQNGKVVGKTPVSVLKVLLYSLTTMISASAIVSLLLAIAEVL